MKKPAEKEILDALKCIIDPDLGRDIVSLGFIKNLSIRETSISLTLELTTPACPVKDQFKKQVEEILLKFSGIEKVSVKISSMSNQNKKNDAIKNSGLNRTGCIVAISSCKGGVGKSTIAAALALNFANRNYKVGLLDTDIYGPSLPTLFKLREVSLSTTKEAHLIPVQHENLKLMSFGFLLGDSPSVLRGPIVSNYIQQLLHKVAWGELDYLFIDMPPGTGDVQLTITQSISLAGAIIVTTPHMLSLVDVSRGILMFEKVQVPILGVIENMSYFDCPDNGKKYYLFGNQATKALKNKFGVSVLGELPIDEQFAFHLEDDNNRLNMKEIGDNVGRAIGSMMIKRHDQKPSIEYDKHHITLTWEPQAEQEQKITGLYKVANKDLRYYCNSARNVNELTGERLIKREDIAKDIQATEVATLGNYAFSVQWSDVHSSIFPYEYFLQLAEMKKEDVLASKK